MKRKKYNLEDVFTYSRPALCTYVERSSINRQFSRAIKVPGTQIILYGHSGTGKTTLLLNKCREHSIGSITSQCVSDTTLDGLIIDALHQLESYYVASTQKKENGNIKGEVGASLLVKAKVQANLSEESTSSQQRIVDVPLTPQTIVKYLGEANKCWVIEDFHKMKKIERSKLAQMMKVFMDASVKYPKVKIITIGAVNSAREMLQLDKELKNRVSEIEVSLMSFDELEHILSKGADLLNIKFPSGAIHKIINYSCGLPGVTHRLAYLLCEYNKMFSTHESNTPFQIQMSYFNDAIEDFLNEEADSYKSKFEIATLNNHKRKYNNPIDILRAILLVEKKAMTLEDIKYRIQKMDITNPCTNLKKYIEEFTTEQRGKILQFNKDAKQYYFTDPLFQVYCKCELKTEGSYSERMRKAVREIGKEELIETRKMFLEDYTEDFDPYFDEEAFLLGESPTLRKL